MHHRRRTQSWQTGALLLALLQGPSFARAGDWHRDRTLVCSDCHTMHNSRGGVPMRYDDLQAPAVLLLRAESATAVCLACHRGDRPSVRAPSVTAPSNGNPPGGGFPADLADLSHRAHALGTTPLLPTYGDADVVMSCVTCHDPHGNGAYRNLRPGPSGTARTTPAPVVNSIVAANGSNPELVYVRSNVRYVSGLSAWCIDCHVGIAAAHSVSADAPAHPWDVAIFGGPTTDWAAWSGSVPNRTAVENPAGSPAPDPGDRVFCLSCHKAHGSPNPAALVYADGATLSSTCQQCHNM